MPKLTKDPFWYNGQDMLSRNAMLNFLYGGRGTGKSFYFKVWCLLAAKGETVWVRRYENEIHDAYQKFIDDLSAEGYITEDMDITFDANTIYLNDDPRIHFVALSVSMKKKSVPYPNVNQIVFDEFIETRVNHKYLPNEPELLLEFISTVNRYRPNRPEVRTFLIGNKVSWYNDYTAYYGIEPFEGKYKIFKNGLICVENYENHEFEDKMKKTRFGQLVAGTKYAAYAIENQALRDSSDFLKKRPKSSWIRVNVRVGPNKYGIWTDGDMLFFSDDHDESHPCFAAREDLHEGERALKSNDLPIVWLKEFNANGKLCFDNGLCKTTCQTLIMNYWK